MKDPHLALKYISFMGDNRDLNMKDLTLKIVILVAFSLREMCPYSEFFWSECGKYEPEKLRIRYFSRSVSSQKTGQPNVSLFNFFLKIN